MKHAQDHFSAIANEYHSGRISYPTELYEYLSGVCEGKLLAWDCATGSGQAASGLSPYFHQIIATDISESLLSLAPDVNNVSFRRASSEDSGIETDSVNLVTVAQAIHWFEHADFWQEVGRVLKSGGVLAFWGYVWPTVDGNVDRLLRDFRQKIEHCWPQRSHHLQNNYKDIEAPFEGIETPCFHLEENWKASDYLAHLASWSGTRYFRDKFGEDPVKTMQKDFENRWGKGIRPVKWALVFKAYRKPKDADLKA
ncbi:MAG: class I SAM-dependent methyltransferase [Verrucomicrobiota bacterium]